MGPGRGTGETESRRDGTRPVWEAPPQLGSRMNPLPGHASGSKPSPISTGAMAPPGLPQRPKESSSASTRPGMARTRSSRLPFHPSPSRPEPPCAPSAGSAVSAYTPYIVRAGFSAACLSGPGGGGEERRPLTHPPSVRGLRLACGEAMSN